ncbi:unnamed protein product, partial [Prorocentrum cordatum]
MEATLTMTSAKSEEALHARELGPDDIAWPADVGTEEDGAIVQAAGAVDEDEGGEGSVAVESDEVVLARLRWMRALEVGYVFRCGVCVGQLSQGGASLNGCRHAVSQKVGERAIMLGLAPGQDVP